MINFGDIIKEEKKELHSNWTEIPDHPYTILTIRSSGSRKSNSLLNLINQQPDIDKVRGRKLYFPCFYIFAVIAAVIFLLLFCYANRY